MGIVGTKRKSVCPIRTIHSRSQILNLNYVRSLSLEFHGTARFLMGDGAKIDGDFKNLTGQNRRHEGTTRTWFDIRFCSASYVIACSLLKPLLVSRGRRGHRRLSSAKCRRIAYVTGPRKIRMGLSNNLLIYAPFGILFFFCVCLSRE